VFSGCSVRGVNQPEAVVSASCREDELAWPMSPFDSRAFVEQWFERVEVCLELPAMTRFHPLGAESSTLLGTFFCRCLAL
jgi:hypothetical protein